MNFYHVIEALVVVSAVFAYVNKRLLKFPITIGLMFLSTLLSLTLLLLNFLYPTLLEPITKLIKELDFSSIVLDILLSFLLFAGALHTDYIQFKRIIKYFLFHLNEIQCSSIFRIFLNLNDSHK